MGYRGWANHRYTEVVSCTIASGQTVSSAIPIGDYIAGCIQVATLTGTAISFQTSADGVTYVQANTAAGAAESVTVSDRRHVPIPASVMQAAYIKLVSNAAEGSARTLQVELKS